MIDFTRVLPRGNVRRRADRRWARDARTTTLLDVRITCLASFLTLALVACDGGEPTGATCPATDPPTYASFGQQFFSTYCTDCHSANSRNRHDAPSDQNFDTEDDIRKHASDIDEWAASGPNATNTDMPELDALVTMPPTKAERELLGQYLACLRP